LQPVRRVPDRTSGSRCAGTEADEVRLELVHRATHLFEEPGALETVALLAGEWFVRHLGATEGGVEDDEWLSHGGQHAGT